MISADSPVANARTVLDLSPLAVRNYWRKHGVRNAVAAMETTETWTVDGQERAEEAIKNLADRLSSTAPDKVLFSITSSTDDVIAFMGFLKTGRALLLFRWLVDINPEMASMLIHDAAKSGNDFGAILCERLRVLEKQHLLSRVFSPERVSLVIEILAESGVSVPSDN